MFKTQLTEPARIRFMHINSLTPRLVVPDPDESIDFLHRALDAELVERFEQDGVVVHAGLRIRDYELSISAEVPEWGWLAPATLGGSAVLLTLDVDDARAVADRMVAEGAQVLVPIEDRPYGRCEGRIQDPAGHLWIPTHEIPAASSEGGERRPTVRVRRIVADLTVTDTTAAIEFFRRLLDLNPVMDLGWVATLKPEARPGGQLTLMTADATATVNPHLSIEVDDLDLVWRRAQEVGADVVHERSVEPWGVERFFVRDPSGNVINILAHANEASTGT